MEGLPKIADLTQATSKNLAYVCTKGTERFLVINGEIFSKITPSIDSQIVCDYDLPLKLPETPNYEPTEDGKSPLANLKDWVNVRLAGNLTGERETNTMPQWGGSCWYYLRFMDTKNADNLAGKEALNYWQNVDEYV